MVFFSKFVVVVASFFTLVVTTPSLAHRFHVGLFNFDEKLPSSCATESCYSLDDLVQHALKYGLESRAEIQALFQARANVRALIGNLLPQVNVVGVLSTVITSAATQSPAIGTDAVIPLVGFLFPSRWFDLQSARHLRSAERESLYTLYANRAQAILHLYYDIHMQIWGMRIFEFYIAEVENLTHFLKKHKRASREDIAVLENIRGQMMYELAFMDNLTASFPQLATAIGLNPSSDWSNMFIEPDNVAAYGINTAEKNYKDHFPMAVERSTELKNVTYLIKSAKNVKRGFYFDYFDPGSGNDLGFGLGSRIKIARSQIEVLNNLYERTRMQLSVAIHNALNNYNDALSAFPGLYKALDSLKVMRRVIDRHINDKNTPIDMLKIQRYFQFAKEQAIRYSQSYFIFKEAEADLNRYTRNGHIYDLVYYYSQEKLPEFLRDVKKQLSFRQATKNKLKKLTKIVPSCSD